MQPEAESLRFAVLRKRTKMEESVILFLFYLRLEGASPSKMTLYRSRLRRLARFCRCPVGALDRALFRRYVEQLRSHLKENTVADHVLAAREFLDWCVGQNYLDENPALAAEGDGQGDRSPVNRASLPRRA